MSSYDDLPSTVQQIVIAAIDSDMKWHGWDGTFFEGYTKHLMGGGRVPSETLHIDDCGNLTYHHDRRMAHYELDWNPVTECYNHWFSVIPAAFTGWDALPESAPFDTPVTQMKAAVSSLVQQAGFSPSGGTEPGSGALGDIGYLNSELALFQGEAMRAFHRYYAAQLPNVISGQAALAHALYFGLATEQRVWADARLDVADIADKALVAMKAARPEESHDNLLGTLFKVAATVAAVAVIVATDGTAAATAATWANFVVGGVARFATDSHSTSTRPKVALGGARPQDVFANLQKRLEEENTEIAKQEGVIVDVTDQAVQTAYSHPDGFNLVDAAKAQIARVHDHPTQLLQDDNAGQLRVHLSVLRELAHSVLPNIADSVANTRKPLGIADDVSLWERPAGIGLDSAYAVWAECQWHLDQVLRDTAWELGAVATHLWQVAKDFHATDGQIHAALVRDTKRIAGGSGAYTGRPLPDPVRHGGPVHAI